MPSRSQLIQPYYPSLDGMRAVAILLVFLIHFFGSFYTSEFFQWGWTGVDVFFVLSGFLITGILYDTIDRPDYFRNFYIRRALRIFPLYYAMWLLVLLATPLLHVQWPRVQLSYLVYLANFFTPGGLRGEHADLRLLIFHLPHHPDTSWVQIGQLWSLSVEEQFYLVWPALVLLVRSRRALMTICAAIIAIEPFARALYLHTHPAAAHDLTVYYNTAFRIDTLLFGALLALWLRGAAPDPARLRRASWALFLVPFAVLVIVLHLQGKPAAHLIETPGIVTYGFTLVGLASCGLLLLALDSSTAIARALRARWLTFLGRISYGLYFVHGVFQGLCVTHTPRTFPHALLWIPALVGILLTIAVAWASFYMLESPFLRLKPRLAPRADAADDPPPFLVPHHNEPA